VLETCRSPIVTAGGVISASVSVGATVFRPDVDPEPTSAQMLVRADAAMYDSKRSGKNRVTMSVSA